MNHERRVGMLILLVALATIVTMLWPLNNLPALTGDDTEVLDTTLEQ